MTKQYEKEVTVERRRWAPDDDYLVIPEMQVFEEQGFKHGDRIKVIIIKEEQ